MSKVLLEIVGSQRVDNEKDKVEMTTVGTLEETDSSYIIKYDEQQEPPMSPIAVSLTVNKDEKSAEVIRNGAVYSCLNIEKSNRRLCRYGTEYGDILMGISGHSIDVDINDGKGSFYLAYDIDINGALASRNDIKLNFKEI